LLDPDVLNWVTQSLPVSEFLDMLFEARMAIEPFAATLACEKATEEDLEKIAVAYQDMAAAETIAESIEPDVRFHQAILDATHNEVIRYIGHTLHNALAISISLTSWDAEIYALSLPRHEAVYKAIAARNPAKANTAVCMLLCDSRSDFDKQRT
jgi:DNA-binding FadR family transcriptional regulator